MQQWSSALPVVPDSIAMIAGLPNGAQVRYPFNSVCSLAQALVPGGWQRGHAALGPVLTKGRLCLSPEVRVNSRSVLVW